MRTVVLSLLLFLGPGAASSAVRRLDTLDGGMCSMVVLSRHRALTAAHCTPIPYSRKILGADLVELSGDWPPPYARLGVPQAGEDVLVEGFGCDPERAWLWRRHVLHVRPGVLLMVTPWPGLELALFARICHGDSGGAVWSEGGNLVGILTAKSETRDYLSFATPVP